MLIILILLIIGNLFRINHFEKSVKSFSVTVACRYENL